MPDDDGAARVLHVAADGTVTEVWTGLTAVTAVAVGPDGTLHAAELSTGNLAEPPFLVPGSGRWWGRPDRTVLRRWRRG